MRKQESMNPETDYLEKMGYETRDIALTVIVKWLGYLFVFIGIMAFISWIAYEVFVPSGEAVKPNRVRVPGQPQVQPFPLRDMQEFRTLEETYLHNFGWVDKEAGAVHIPLERAMELTLERGLSSGVNPNTKPPVLDPRLLPGLVTPPETAHPPQGTLHTVTPATGTATPSPTGTEETSPPPSAGESRTTPGPPVNVPMTDPEPQGNSPIR